MVACLERSSAQEAGSRSASKPALSATSSAIPAARCHPRVIAKVSTLPWPRGSRRSGGLKAISPQRLSGLGRRGGRVLSARGERNCQVAGDDRAPLLDHGQQEPPHHARGRRQGSGKGERCEGGSWHADCRCGTAGIRCRSASWDARFFTVLPTAPEFNVPGPHFRVAQACRFPSASGCVLDALGDHRAARTRALACWSVPLERTAARICREAGARVAPATSTSMRRCWTTAAWRLQVAVDTLVSPVRADGAPRPGADREPGLALRQIRRRAAPACCSSRCSGRRASMAQSRR